MYAEITYDKPPIAVLEKAADQPGFVGGYALSHLSGTSNLTITLWDAQAEDRMEVVHRVRNDVVPGAANLIHFAGPISDEVFAAADYAGRNRLEPRLSKLDGSAGVVVMWDPARRQMLVLSLATSLDRLEEIGRFANSMELLPEEDPALLPQVEHVDIYHVDESR